MKKSGRKFNEKVNYTLEHSVKKSSNKSREVPPVVNIISPRPAETAAKEKFSVRLRKTSDKSKSRPSPKPKSSRSDVSVSVPTTAKYSNASWRKNGHGHNDKSLTTLYKFSKSPQVHKLKISLVQPIPSRVPDLDNIEILQQGLPPHQRRKSANLGQVIPAPAPIPPLVTVKKSMAPKWNTATSMTGWINKPFKSILDGGRESKSKSKRKKGTRIPDDKSIYRDPPSESDATSVETKILWKSKSTKGINSLKKSINETQIQGKAAPSRKRKELQSFYEQTEAKTARQIANSQKTVRRAPIPVHARPTWNDSSNVPPIHKPSPLDRTNARKKPNSQIQTTGPNSPRLQSKPQTKSQIPTPIRQVQEIKIISPRPRPRPKPNSHRIVMPFASTQTSRSQSPKYKRLLEYNVNVAIKNGNTTKGDMAKVLYPMAAAAKDEDLESLLQGYGYDYDIPTPSPVSSSVEFIAIPRPKTPSTRSSDSSISECLSDIDVTIGCSRATSTNNRELKKMLYESIINDRHRPESRKAHNVVKNLDDRSENVIPVAPATKQDNSVQTSKENLKLAMGKDKKRSSSVDAIARVEPKGFFGWILSVFRSKKSKSPAVDVKAKESDAKRLQSKKNLLSLASWR